MSIYSFGAVEYRETAPSISRLGTGPDMGSGAVLLPAVRPAARPHVGLSHANPALGQSLCLAWKSIAFGDPAASESSPVI